MHGLISGFFFFLSFSIDLYIYIYILCVCVCVCQYHTVLMTVALWYSLKSGKVIPPALFFLKIALAVRGLQWSHINFRIICFSSVKKGMGIFVGTAFHL